MTMLRRFRHALRAALGDVCDRVADWLMSGPPEPVAAPPLTFRCLACGGEWTERGHHLEHAGTCRGVGIAKPMEDTMPKQPKQPKRKGPKRAPKPPPKGKARSAISGKYVTRKHAKRNPRSTVTETE